MFPRISVHGTGTWYCKFYPSRSVPGELGVPVVDVLLLVPGTQLLDDLAQHHQGLVDVAALLQSR